MRKGGSRRDGKGHIAVWLRSHWLIKHTSWSSTVNSEVCIHKLTKKKNKQQKLGNKKRADWICFISEFTIYLLLWPDRDLPVKCEPVMHVDKFIPEKSTDEVYIKAMMGGNYEVASHITGNKQDVSSKIQKNIIYKNFSIKNCIVHAMKQRNSKPFVWIC